MDANAQKRGDGVEGALAALAGAGILLLLGWRTLPVALAAMPSAAAAGAIVGAWRPRWLGVLAFGTGCGTAIVALAASGQGLSVLIGWLLLAPCLAFPIGSALVPLRLADPPASPPPGERPEWAERTFGSEASDDRAGGARFGGSDVGVSAEPSERRSAIVLACVGALLVWPGMLLAVGVSASALMWLIPVLTGVAVPLWADGEFLLEGLMLTLFCGVPGLCVAAARLAGERRHLAFQRGVGVSVGHALLALIAIMLSAIWDEPGWLLGYFVIGAAWAWGWNWGWRRLSARRSGTASRL